ncbi:hypothetical protein OHT52_07355 [Streptomyces sp. NBC_00247]|uniref:hypothetical protein n=1 Tax=Streptomyces sp. NBC_00247 TaxID=2975689 RepID=UPI002E2A1326|nr:hypothetical protein [Streptomyces sp. NBC_00247]
MIRASDLVICGKHTREVVGVAIELEISRQEGIPGFLLNRYDGQTGAEQTTERVSDKLYTWTWPLLETLAGGAR